MTLEAQLDILHQLIKENPDITIAEFIEIVTEIDAITPKIEHEWETKKCADDVRRKSRLLSFSSGPWRPIIVLPNASHAIPKE